MRTLNRYILWDYLVIFLSALGLITFVMTIGAMVKAVDLMARGISPALIGKFFLLNIPYILSFSTPISTLFAALLLFGRLSMDSELSAMKACGLSLGRLVAPLIVLSVVLSAACVYVNCEVAPTAKHANRQLLREAGVEEPINLLEEGRFITDFPGLMIYVGKKKGNVIEDIIAYKLTESGAVERSVRAERGEISADNEEQVLWINLFNARVESPDEQDPFDVSKTDYINAEYFPVKLDFKELMSSSKSSLLKRSHMTMTQLIEQIRNVPVTFANLSASEQQVMKTGYIIEANRRVSLAVGCFTFMLIGIPLGVKSHRKETSTGMVLSLAIVFIYYIFIVIAKALAGYPELHPALILWIPLILMQIAGFVMIRRSS
jgi:lipopolysaccharide export system permease protein